MDNCRHVGHMTIAKDHSVLNPEKWQCDVCYTTESVWVCKPDQKKSSPFNYSGIWFLKPYMLLMHEFVYVFLLKF